MAFSSVLSHGGARGYSNAVVITSTGGRTSRSAGLGTWYSGRNSATFTQNDDGVPEQARPDPPSPPARSPLIRRKAILCQRPIERSPRDTKPSSYVSFRHLPGRKQLPDLCPVIQFDRPKQCDRPFFRRYGARSISGALAGTNSESNFETE